MQTVDLESLDLFRQAPAKDDTAQACSQPLYIPHTKHASAARVVRARGRAGALKVGVAAARALGFDVLPKASAVQRLAPAPGLRPSINAPLPTGNAKQARVCVSYLCWARCDRGAACPEAGASSFRGLLDHLGVQSLCVVCQAHIMDPEEEMLEPCSHHLSFSSQACARKVQAPGVQSGCELYTSGAPDVRFRPFSGTTCLFRHPGELVEEVNRARAARSNGRLASLRIKPKISTFGF